MEHTEHFSMTAFGHGKQLYGEVPYSVHVTLTPPDAGAGEDAMTEYDREVNRILRESACKMARKELANYDQNVTSMLVQYEGGEAVGEVHLPSFMRKARRERGLKAMAELVQEHA